MGVKNDEDSEIFSKVADKGKPIHFEFRITCQTSRLTSQSSLTTFIDSNLISPDTLLGTDDRSFESLQDLWHSRP